MNALDNRLRKLVLKAVRKVCTEPVTYRRHTEGEYDPDTRTAAPGFQEFKVFALANSGGADEGKGGLEAGEMKLSLPAVQLPFEPSVGDEIGIDSVTWKVVGIDAEYATSPHAVINWMLKVKRG